MQHSKLRPYLSPTSGFFQVGFGIPTALLGFLVALDALLGDHDLHGPKVTIFLQHFPELLSSGTRSLTIDIYIIYIYMQKNICSKERPESDFHISRASFEPFSSPRFGWKYRRSLSACDPAYIYISDACMRYLCLGASSMWVTSNGSWRCPQGSLEVSTLELW